jgi:hypothetical protein
MKIFHRGVRLSGGTPESSRELSVGSPPMAKGWPGRSRTLERLAANTKIARATTPSAMSAQIYLRATLFMALIVPRAAAAALVPPRWQSS